MGISSRMARKRHDPSLKIWRTYAEVRSELQLLKDEVLLQEKTNEGFASREEKCRVEA